MPDSWANALSPTIAGGNGGQRVGHGQAQVVVAVRRKNDAMVVDGRNALTHFEEHLRVLFGGGVADGVGHVDGGGAGLDGDAHNLDQEVSIGSGGVFGRELD